MHLRSLLLLLVASLAAACNGAATNGLTSGSTGTAGGNGGTGGTGGGMSGPAKPAAEFLPKPAGACPEFVTGKSTFSPAGIAPRDVMIWTSDAVATGGPLVFFWHGAGGSPTEATYALAEAIVAVKAQGGVVAAAYHDPAAGQLPWFLSLGGSTEDDLLVADEVLACALEKKGIDTRRIHSVGFSAGAMHTTQFAARRSGYLASVVVFSGARLGTPPVQDPSNKYPAMLTHGGPNDQVIISFDDAAQTYHDALGAEGHFSFLCNHNKGHTVASDSRAGAWQFLQDHPFGQAPEPYTAGLPAVFPTYCSL